jgi:hypothetical protein
MLADADHEVIDSPEALFRHLHEDHGVAEALELDPETAPVQFWLRRHAELEHTQRAARRSGPPPDPSPPGGAAPGPEPAARSRPDPGPRAAPRPEPAPAREGRRQHARFGDPLLEAMTRALVGRGHDETAVRSAIRSFPAGGAGPAGEAGVRAAFVEPMLQAVTEHLLDPRGPQPAPAAAGPPPAPARPAPAAAGPPPAPPRPAPDPPSPREEPARPEAAWAVLWADLADTGRQAGEDGGPGGDEGDDLMAVANAVQARRRVRLLRR